MNGTLTCAFSPNQYTNKWYRWYKWYRLRLFLSRGATRPLLQIESVCTTPQPVYKQVVQVVQVVQMVQTASVLHPHPRVCV